MKIATCMHCEMYSDDLVVMRLMLSNSMACEYRRDTAQHVTGFQDLPIERGP